MLLKLILLIVAVVNVKAVDNFIDENGRVLLQVPTRNEGSRYFQIQRGPDGEMTGLVEVLPVQEPEPAQPVLVESVIFVPKPGPSQAVVIPVQRPNPTPNQVVVNPAKRPEPIPSQVEVIPPAKTLSPVISRECPSPYGLYELSDNECSNYIVCVEGVATLMACPKGLVFNPTLQACDWLENMPSCRPLVFSGVTCPASHEDDVDQIFKYRYGQSCTEYIACHRGAPRLLKCDAGLAFDEQLESCVAADRVKSCSYSLI